MRGQLNTGRNQINTQSGSLLGLTAQTSLSDNYKTNKSLRIVLDNGSSHLRVGKASPDPETIPKYKTVRNLIASHKRSPETLIGEDAERVMNEEAYRYQKPHVRGVLTNFDVQMNIWGKYFGEIFPEKSAKGRSLSISSPYVVPDRAKEKLLEILFEFYGFSAVFPTK